MIPPEQKSLPHPQPDTDTVVAHITENKISRFLSAGYSTRVQSVLRVHPLQADQ
jgi:hypothetical protein